MEEESMEEVMVLILGSNRFPMAIPRLHSQHE